MELKFFDVILPRPPVFRPSQQKNVFFAPPNFCKKSTIFSLGATFRIRAGKKFTFFLLAWSGLFFRTLRPHPEIHAKPRKLLSDQEIAQKHVFQPKSTPRPGNRSSRPGNREFSQEIARKHEFSLENTFSSQNQCSSTLFLKKRDSELVCDACVLSAGL